MSCGSLLLCCGFISALQYRCSLLNFSSLPLFRRFSSEQLGVLLMQLFFAVTGAQGSLAVVMGTAPSLLVFSIVQVSRFLEPGAECFLCLL